MVMLVHQLVRLDWRRDCGRPLGTELADAQEREVGDVVVDDGEGDDGEGDAGEGDDGAFADEGRSEDENDVTTGVLLEDLRSLEDAVPSKLVEVAERDFPMVLLVRPKRKD